MPFLCLGALARRHGETLASGHLATVTKLAQPTVAKVLKMLLAAELVETQRGVRAATGSVRFWRTYLLWIL